MPALNYGGLEIGIAVFLGLCARRAEWQRIGLVATVLMLGGAATMRTASMVLDGPIVPIHRLLLGAEVVGAGLALWALGSRRRVPSEAAIE